MFKKRETRFVEILKESYSSGLLSILVDRETGVHYVHTWASTGGSGLTPLLDENGKVVVKKLE
ncbi:DUF6440 family protein [Cytobacillus sp. FSL M8-0252]|uniref:DUF6440 family protein n=1 Tax=Cytobacillus sp. FSL M8-0252 TaxID=2921621 RepID=UPI0030F688D0